MYKRQVLSGIGQTSGNTGNFKQVAKAEASHQGCYWRQKQRNCLLYTSTGNAHAKDGGHDHDEEACEVKVIVMNDGQDEVAQMCIRDRRREG